MKKLLSKWFMGDIVQKYRTNAGYSTVMEKLEEVVNEHSFAVLTTHDLKETYTKKALQLAPDFEYRIVQICNAPKSHKALNELGFDMGVMMPKNLIVARENGATTIRFMKMKPWITAMMFPDLDIAPLSKKVMQTLEDIVAETIRRAEK